MSSSSTGYYNTPLSVSTFYDYDPVFGILVAAAVVFSLETAVLLYQSLRSRTYFLLWLVLFTASEAGGYIGFSIFVKSPTLSGYLAELIIIILAPNLVTLVNYTVISRIIPWAGFDTHSRIYRYAHWVPIVFVTSDLLCLTIQGIGGSQLSSAHHDGVVDTTKFNLGKNLTLAGISAQLGFQTLFATVAVYVYVKMPDVEMKQRLRLAWWCMLLTMALVYVRNIYRIVEFAGGQHAAIDETSVPYFVLDTLMMALVGVVFIVLDLGSESVLPESIRYKQKVAGSEASMVAAKPQSKSLGDVEMGQARDSSPANRVETTVRVMDVGEE